MTKCLRNDMVESRQPSSSRPFLARFALVSSVAAQLAWFQQIALFLASCSGPVLPCGPLRPSPHQCHPPPPLSRSTMRRAAQWCPNRQMIPGQSLAQHYPGHGDPPEMESESRSQEAQHRDRAQPLPSHFFGN